MEYEQVKPMQIFTKMDHVDIHKLALKLNNLSNEEEEIIFETLDTFSVNSQTLNKHPTTTTFNTFSVNYLGLNKTQKYRKTKKKWYRAKKSRTHKTYDKKDDKLQWMHGEILGFQHELKRQLFEIQSSTSTTLSRYKKIKIISMLLSTLSYSK